MHRASEGGYGWAVVGAAFVSHAVAFGLIYSFSVFFPPILDEFEQGRGAIAWIVALAASLMLGAAGVSGRLADRWGPRPVMLSGAGLLGAGLLLSGAAAAAWQVVFAYGIFVGVGASLSFIPALGAVGQWFTRRRGLATGLAVAGSGVGTIIMAPLSHALIEAWGWRGAMRVLAVAGAILLAAAATAVRGRLPPAGAGGGALAVARGSGTFRLLYLSALVASYGYWVPFVHIVPYAQDRGIEPAAAALLVSLMGIANTAGRVIMGALADRTSRLRMLQVSSLAMTIGLFAWPLATSRWTLAVFAAGYAVFAGAFIALLPALTGDYFGVQRLAGVTGLLFTGAALGTLLGPPLSGLLFDQTGTYTLAIVIAGTTMAVGTMLILPLPDPRRAETTAPAGGDPR